MLSQPYLAKPGRHGQARKPTHFRLLDQGYGQDMPNYRAGWLESYRDRYDLLGSPRARLPGPDRP